MKFAHQRVVAAVLLAGLGIAAQAQTPPPSVAAGDPASAMQPSGRAPGMHEGHGMHERMKAHRAERTARRMAKLKEALRITPAQEGAWTTYTSAIKPGSHKRPDIGEMARLTTPERIDRMRAMRAQRTAEQDRRGDATKSFYAALTPEQKRVFDQLNLHRFGGAKRGHGQHLG